MEHNIRDYIKENGTVTEIYLIMSSVKNRNANEMEFGENFRNMQTLDD